MAGRRFVKGAIPILLHPERLEEPLRWRKPRRVFVCSLADLFHEDVPDAFIDRVFATMALAGGDTEHHTFQVLTKRPERMRAYLSTEATEDRVSDVAYQIMAERNIYPGAAMQVALGRGRLAHQWPSRNVWLGVSVENQRWADERIPVLLDTPAAVRFLSCEPLLGPLKLDCFHVGPSDRWLDALTGEWYGDDVEEDSPSSRISWVIAGGMSGGPESRWGKRWLVERCNHWPMTEACHGTGWRPKPQALEWLRSLREQCVAAGVPFFFKQFGGPRPTSGGRLLDGRTWDEMPVRQEVAVGA